MDSGAARRADILRAVAIQLNWIALLGLAALCAYAAYARMKLGYWPLLLGTLLAITLLAF